MIYMLDLKFKIDSKINFSCVCNAVYACIINIYIYIYIYIYIVCIWLGYMHTCNIQRGPSELTSATTWDIFCHLSFLLIWWCHHQNSWSTDILRINIFNFLQQRFDCKKFVLVILYFYCRNMNKQNFNCTVD